MNIQNIQTSDSTSIHTGIALNGVICYIYTNIIFVVNAILAQITFLFKKPEDEHFTFGGGGDDKICPQVKRQESTREDNKSIMNTTILPNKSDLQWFSRTFDSSLKLERIKRIGHIWYASK